MQRTNALVVIGRILVSMKILNGFEAEAIKQAVDVLTAGGVVAFPTETVYGLGADALNPYAVAKIFEIKRRPTFDPLIIHIAGLDSIYNIAEYVPALASQIMDRFWPGPLTIILNKKDTIPDIVTAGLSTVGIRMPSHQVALDLIKALGRPIAAPSANPFGYISPTKVKHVVKSFEDQVPIVLDGGDSRLGIESTIISISDNRVIVHRHGAVPVEEIRDMGVAVEDKKKNDMCEAPGELPYHYAPMKPLRLVNTIEEVVLENSSFLGFAEQQERPVSKHIRYLSLDGDLREAAANFFSHLIDLDREDVEIIYAERIPERGLGKAMMERLKKAARKCVS
jgi:L-threonylcarbamoyladenylate synthase